MSTLRVHDIELEVLSRQLTLSTFLHQWQVNNSAHEMLSNRTVHLRPTAAAAATAAAAGVLLMRLLPGSLQYREVPAALLRGWMLGKVRPLLL
jgi:hypothetical protein